LSIKTWTALSFPIPHPPSGIFWGKLSGTACILGCISALIVLFITEFGIYHQRNKCEGCENVIMGDVKILSSAWATIVNIIASAVFTIIFEFINPKINDDSDKVKWMQWDALGEKVNARYGEKQLSKDVLDETCKSDGTVRPTETYFGWFLFLFGTLAPVLALPWGEKEFEDQGMMGVFPLWAGKYFICLCLSMFASIWQVSRYRPGNSSETSAVVEWAGKTGADKLGPAQLMRRMSHELLKDDEAFKEDSRLPTKVNQVEPDLPGAPATKTVE